MVRDTIILLCTWSGFSWIYRQTVKRTRPLTRIVVFHDVPDPVWFEEMIKTVSTETHVLSPAEFRDGTRDSKRINTLITFDDGYASWVNVALPILESFGLKALFFINSGLLDSTESEAEIFMKENLMIRPRASLTWDGARALITKGHTIGGHSRSHQNLAREDSPTVRAEVQGDKTTIETKLGVRVDDFAYPFGTHAHFTKETMRIAKEIGYTRAYTAESGFVQDSETFAIPRMCIETGQSSPSLIRWLNGSYDLFLKLKSLCVR